MKSKIVEAPQKSKSVGIWLRVSTEDQAKGESPEHHEKRARYYAESKGWKVVEVYHLEGVSGKTVAEHPEAKRMMADVKRGRITGLIFSKLARLARNTRELLDFADFFRDAGADLVSLQESIDTSTPAGRLFYTMIAAMAQWEREEIASRVSASVSIRAKMGKPLGGQAPFGYQWKDRQLVPHPDEAPVRKLVHDLFLEHKRRKTVARLLNERGFRTRNGSKFSDTTVQRLLQDPTAKGKHRLNYTTSKGPGKAWDLKPQDEWEYMEVEPVVSPEVWDRCNAMIDGAHRKRPARRTTHLFAGLVCCECGSRMYVLSGSPKYVCQACRNKIPADDLEAIFVEQLRGFFVSPQEVAGQIEKADEGLREKEHLLDLKRREAARVGKEVHRVYRLYVDEQSSGDEFLAIYRPLQEHKKGLEEDIAKAEAELDYLKINRLSADEIISEASTLYGRWPNLTPEERRSVVESITEKIVVGKSDDAGISIELAYIPSSEEELTKGQRNFTDSWPPPA